MCADLAATGRHTPRYRLCAQSLRRRHRDISGGGRRRADFDGDAIRGDRRATCVPVASTTFATHWLLQRVRLLATLPLTQLVPD